MKCQNDPCDRDLPAYDVHDATGPEPLYCAPCIAAHGVRECDHCGRQILGRSVGYAACAECEEDPPGWRG